MHIIMADIPVYLVAGFWMPARPISSTASWRTASPARIPHLLLCCEEGEEEYEKNALDNVTVITIEDEEDLKCPT